MLVLTRKQNQEIVIDGEIRVVVMKVCGNRVTIGVSAPSSVSVRRQEINSRPRCGAREPRLELLGSGI